MPAAIAEIKLLRAEWAALKHSDLLSTPDCVDEKRVLKPLNYDRPPTNKKTKPGKTKPAMSLSKPMHSDILVGVVALVEVGSEYRALALRAALSALGASVVPNWSALVTHVVWGEGGSSSIRANARTYAARLVSPLWVEACVTANDWLPERVFPTATRDSDLPSPRTVLQLLREADSRKVPLHVVLAGLTAEDGASSSEPGTGAATTRPAADMPGTGNHRNNTAERDSDLEIRSTPSEQPGCSGTVDHGADKRASEGAGDLGGNEDRASDDHPTGNNIRAAGDHLPRLDSEPITADDPGAKARTAEPGDQSPGPKAQGNQGSPREQAHSNTADLLAEEDPHKDPKEALRPGGDTTKPKYPFEEDLARYTGAAQRRDDDDKASSSSYGPGPTDDRPGPSWARADVPSSSSDRKVYGSPRQDGHPDRHGSLPADDEESLPPDPADRLGAKPKIRPPPKQKKPKKKKSDESPAPVINPPATVPDYATEEISHVNTLPRRALPVSLSPSPPRELSHHRSRRRTPPRAPSRSPTPPLHGHRRWPPKNWTRAPRLPSPSRSPTPPNFRPITSQAVASTSGAPLSRSPTPPLHGRRRWQVCQPSPQLSPQRDRYASPTPGPSRAPHVPPLLRDQKRSPSPGPSRGRYKSPSPGPSRGRYRTPSPGPSRGRYKSPSPGPSRGRYPSPLPGPSRGQYKSPSPDPFRDRYQSPSPGPSSGRYKSPSPGPSRGHYRYPSPGPSRGRNKSPSPGPSRGHYRAPSPAPSRRRHKSRSPATPHDCQGSPQGPSPQSRPRYRLPLSSRARPPSRSPSPSTRSRKPMPTLRVPPLPRGIHPDPLQDPEAGPSRPPFPERPRPSIVRRPRSSSAPNLRSPKQPYQPIQISRPRRMLFLHRLFDDCRRENVEEDSDPEPESDEEAFWDLYWDNRRRRNDPHLTCHCPPPRDYDLWEPAQRPPPPSPPLPPPPSPPLAPPPPLRHNLQHGRVVERAIEIGFYHTSDDSDAEDEPEFALRHPAVAAVPDTVRPNVLPSSPRHESKALARAERSARRYFDRPGTPSPEVPLRQRSPTPILFPVRPRIVLTGMSTEERARVTNACMYLGGRIQNRVTRNTTHVLIGSFGAFGIENGHAGIVPVRNGCAPRPISVRLRTVNALAGAVRGCRVLRAQWALDSLAADAWITHHSYLIPYLKTLTERASAERHAFGLTRADYAFDVFNGRRVIISLECEQRDALVELLALCGAVIYDHEGHIIRNQETHERLNVNRSIHIGHDDELVNRPVPPRTGRTENGDWAGSNLEHSSDVTLGVQSGQVTPRWVFDSVASGRMRSLHRYTVPRDG